MTDFREMAADLRDEVAKPLRDETMTEQDAIERVAMAIAGHVTPLGIAIAAIAAYNAYLRERATDDDVVDAVVSVITHGWDDCEEFLEPTANSTLTAALDAMLGKEDADDR